MDSRRIIESLFGVRRALIGVVHLQALPGTPANKFDVATIKSIAVDEAAIYKETGFHGILIENTHDRPYLKGAVGPEIVAAMSVVGAEVRRAVALPLGVQVLAGANSSALAVALASDASFVRVEGFVFAHVADEGLIESSAGNLLRYRRAIGADHIRVFADVKKKHAAHAVTADVTVPTLVGSGITAENISLFSKADALIVGSSVKQNGLWSNPIDVERARKLRQAFEG